MPTDPRQLDLFERLAAEVYRRNGLDLSEPIAPLDLARMDLGDQNVVWMNQTSGSEALYLDLDTGPTIVFSKSVPISKLNPLAAHEHAHKILREFGLRDDEDTVKAFSGTLTAPRRVFERVARATGGALAHMAGILETNQTYVALREAELYGIPRVVVTRNHHWALGEARDWAPSREELEALRKSSKLPGIRKSRITDIPGRFVLEPRRRSGR